MAALRHQNGALSVTPSQLSLFSTEAKSGNEERVPVKFLSLNNLHDNPGAIKKKRRVGRGIGSSKGKTSGRGHKGQNARAGGGTRPTFEGGQTPLFKTLPKRGFRSHKKPLVALNLGRLQDFIDMGRFPGVGDSMDNPITLHHMVKAGMLKPNTTAKHGGAKLLADGKDRLTSEIHLEIGRASSEAIQIVEEKGGSVTTFHFNKKALRQRLKPEKIEYMYREARPPPKYQAYYTNWNKRGYLHPAIQLRKWFLNEGSDFEEKFLKLQGKQGGKEVDNTE